MKLVPLIPTRSRVFTASTQRLARVTDPRLVTLTGARGLVPSSSGSDRMAGWYVRVRVGRVLVKARSVCGLVGFGPVRRPSDGAVIAWRARVLRAGVLAWLDHDAHRSARGVTVTRSWPWVRLDRGRRYGQRADVEHAGGTTSYAHLRQERPGAAAHLGGKA